MSRNLSIAELARETGLNQATIRSWEARHGFPRPRRLPGGHRRYREEDVEILRRVQAERTAGATLSAAIERARWAGEGAPESIFAEVGRRSGLGSQEVSKRTMVALSHALEDELAVRGDRGVLVGAFQRRRFLEAAAPRWRDLARSSRRAVAFVDEPDGAAEGPIEVRIAPGSPFEREWAIVHLARRSSALMLARELPGPAPGDLDRRFELFWSVDPELVRAALAAAAALAEPDRPDVARDLASDAEGGAAQAGVDPAFVTALSNRMIGRLDR
jgi:DICT domain-containing protein/predicted DNA-binding transcriptional regulator AlpA